MQRAGPVIIIEDDVEDQEIFTAVFKELHYENELKFFNTGDDALDYLNGEGRKVIPFIILSDINLPKLTGYALRDKVREDAELEIRCIPYLFFTTTNTKQAVIDAYSKNVQGFFTKPASFAKLKRTIQIIMDYWTECAAPNNYD